MTSTNYQINEISTQSKGVDISVYYSVTVPISNVFAIDVSI